MKVIADHATARHTSQISADFSFTLPPPVVSVSWFSKLRHCLTRGERFGNSTVGSGTPAVEHSRRSVGVLGGSGEFPWVSRQNCHDARYSRPCIGATLGHRTSNL